MTTQVRVAAFAVLLALVFAGAYAVGFAVGPPSSSADEPTAGHAAMPGGSQHDEARAVGTDATTGLASSTGGYTLVPATSLLVPGNSEVFAFRVTGPGGLPQPPSTSTTTSECT
jgi:hypothetical protein